MDLTHPAPHLAALNTRRCVLEVRPAEQGAALARGEHGSEFGVGAGVGGADLGALEVVRHDEVGVGLS